MAQLFFKYGAMNSGKSIEILKAANNYEEQGKAVLLFTTATDNRSGRGIISSRIGLSRKAEIIYEDTDIYQHILADENQAAYACIMIDEAQFMTKNHVLQLTRIVDDLDIPVMAFGLKNDFKNNLFEGSKALLIYSEKIEEIKTICWFCHKKAIMNMRVNNGKAVYEGEQIQIGGNESYYPVCRKHYFNPPLDDM